MRFLISLLLGCLTVTSFAASMKDLTWNVKKGSATIIKCESTAEGDLVIPEYTEDGDRIIAIDKNAFKNVTKLTSITLPDSIKTIGKDAFSGCTSLEVNKIKMPASLKTLSKGAFTNCKVTLSTARPGEVLSFPIASTYKAATSVSGFKINKKTNTLTATFKKPGTYEAVFFKVGEPLSVHKIEVSPLTTLTVISIDGNEKCKTKGTGAYLVGKKVSITATPAKDKIFLGFYKDAEGKDLITETAKYSYVMTNQDTTIYAKFKTEVIEIDNTNFKKEPWEKGRSVDLKIVAKTDSGVKSLKAKLPKGLKLKKVGTDWFIQGTPTVAGPQTATFTVSTMKKQSSVIPIEFTIAEETMSLNCDAIPNKIEDNVAMGDKEIIATATSGVKTLTAKGLPSGLKLKKVGTTWYVTGTPKAKSSTTSKVTITATSTQKTVCTTTFDITVFVDPNKPKPVNLPDWADGNYVGQMEYENLNFDGGYEDADGVAAMSIARNGKLKGYIGFGNGLIAEFTNSTVKVLEQSSSKLKLELIVDWYHIDDIVSEDLRGEDWDDILDEIDPDNELRDAIGFDFDSISAGDIDDIYKALKNVGKTINKVTPIVEKFKAEGKIDLSQGPIRRAKTILLLKKPKHDWLEKFDPVEISYSDIGDNINDDGSLDNLQQCKITGDLTQQ